MNEINNDIIINRSKFLSSELGEEMMLMNLDTGDYIGLNAVSADIFKLAEERTTINQIISSLLDKYEVDEEKCRIQVIDCIENMLKKEVLLKI